VAIFKAWAEIFQEVQIQCMQINFKLYCYFSAYAIAHFKPVIPDPNPVIPDPKPVIPNFKPVIPVPGLLFMILIL